MSGADDKDEVLVAKIVYDAVIMQEKYGAETDEQTLMDFSPEEIRYLQEIHNRNG